MTSNRQQINLVASEEPMKLARQMKHEKFNEGWTLPGVWWWRGCFWVFSGMRWRMKSVEDMEGMALLWMEDKSVETEDGYRRLAPTRQLAKEVVFAMKALSSAWWKAAPSWTNPQVEVDAKECVAFEDQVVRVVGGKWERVGGTRGPEWFGAVVPCDLEQAEKAECPTWERCVGEWGNGDAGWGRLLQRVMGYMLGNKKRMRKWALLEGKAGGGKSVIAHVMGVLAGGEPWVMCTDAQTLAGDFGVAGVDHASLVIVHELTKMAGPGGENVARTFKQLVGGDPMPIQRKYQDVQAGVVCNAGVMVLSNVVPDLPNDAAGLSQKMVVLPFTRTFDGRGADPALVEKLEREREGIAGWALRGLADVMAAEEGERWPMPTGSEGVVRAYRVLSNPADAFLEEMFVKDAAGFVPGRIVRDMWDQFCADEPRARVVGKKTLVEWLCRNSTGWEITQDRRRVGSEFVRGVRGMGIKKVTDG